MCSSCGVSSARVSSRRLRTCSPVASSSRRPGSANASAPIAREDVVGRAQLLTSIDPAALASQPLAVQQVSVGEVGPQPRATQAFDRLAMERLGCVPLDQQRSRPGFEPERPIRVARFAVATNRSYASSAMSRLPAPDGRLDQLDERPGRDVQPGCVVDDVLGGGQRVVIATERVVEDRARPTGECDTEPLSAYHRVGQGGIDECWTRLLSGPRTRRGASTRTERCERPSPA